MFLCITVAVEVRSEDERNEHVQSIDKLVSKRRGKFCLSERCRQKKLKIFFRKILCYQDIILPIIHYTSSSDY